MPVVEWTGISGLAVVSGTAGDGRSINATKERDKGGMTTKVSCQVIPSHPDKLNVAPSPCRQLMCPYAIEASSVYGGASSGSDSVCWLDA